MFTLCTYCDAAYQVSPEALVRGRGHLHCNTCGRDFDALERLTRDLPDGIAQAAAAIPTGSAPMPRSPGIAAASEPVPSMAPAHAQGALELPPPIDPDADWQAAAPTFPFDTDTQPPASVATADLEPGPHPAGPDPAVEPAPQPDAGIPLPLESLPSTASTPEPLPAEAPAAVPSGDDDPPASEPAPTVFVWLAPEAAKPAPASEAPAALPASSEARVDVLVEVLTAHADFIEPLEPEADGDTAGKQDERHELTAPFPNHVTAAPLPFQTESAESEESDAPGHDHASVVDDLATNAPPAHGGELPAAAEAHPPQTPRPRDSAAGHRPLALDDPAAAARDLTDPFHPVLGAPAPSFIAVPALPDAPRPRRWPLWLGVGVLACVLAIQCVVAERAALAADARWRPWLQRTCDVLRCTLPPWHEPAAMQLMTRDVRPHPSVPDALLISASFRNDARWAQPWPRLDLTLSDLDGRPIARREFSPTQYLGMGARQSLIQPGQTASVALEVRDPGKQAVAFAFDFR